MEDDYLWTYEVGNTIKITDEYGYILSGEIIQLKSNEKTCRLPVVEIRVHDINSNLPEGETLPPSVVVKIYDYHFLPKELYTDPITDAIELCDREAAAYEILSGAPEVQNCIAPYGGRYKYKSEVTPEYESILLASCKGFSPKGLLSRHIAEKLVETVKTVIRASHRYGITHGDLEAGNLLVESIEGDGLVILDWANSCSLERYGKAVFDRECKRDEVALGKLVKELISAQA